MGALYFLLNVRNLGVLPICTFILFQNIHWFFLNIMMAFIVGDEFDFSMDVQKGVFGFLNQDIVWKAFLLMGLVSNIFGNVCYTLSLLFFDPLVVTSICLVEPFIA
jgi:drug/metabolite transporter (DMT)-like permease